MTSKTVIKHMPELIIALVLILSLTAAAVWDVVTLAGAGSATTVSEIIYRWSREYPMLPLVIGIIIGHLFFPQSRK